jgi:hypothetical protein
MEGVVIRFEAMILDVLTLVNVCLNIVFSWHMTPCSLLDKNQRFAGKCCLLLEDNCDLKGGRRTFHPSVGACVRSFTASHVGRKNLHSVRFYHGICLEGLRKSTKDLFRGWLSPDHVLNVEPLQYESGEATYHIVQVSSSSET